MNNETYYIPANFTDAGRVMGLFELLYEIINKRTSRRVQLPEGVFDMTTAVHGVFEE